MERPLIIAEKPSAARAIADALGGFGQGRGYLESREYLLTWAVGHLAELQEPEEYDPRLKRWSLGALPLLPAEFRLRVAPKAKGQFGVVQRLAARAPALINACDAGREGELIFRYILALAGVRVPVQRLWISSLTREAIRRGFRELRPGSEFDLLYRSAECRSQGDWLVGINATRAFTCRFGGLLSLGRVQTPTLAMVVSREREIAAFCPEAYWEVWADFRLPSGQAYRGKWFTDGGDRLPAAAAAAAVADRVRGHPGTVAAATIREVNERPPGLFDLTTLQREANRRYGLTAANTLKTAQGLYEARLITYPRTDSRYLTPDLVRILPATLRSLAEQPDFAALATQANPGLVHPGNRRVVDARKVGDHHAIIPTGEAPKGLAAAAAKVYGLVVRRFLAQFFPDARVLESEVVTRVGADPFRTRGRRVLSPGWQVAETPETGNDGKGRRSPGKAADDAVADLPAIPAGADVHTAAAEVLAKETQPPRRFTEASLLAAMETAGRQVEDEELREAMKGRGLGTPATRAAVIERLKAVGYVVLDKKYLLPTAKGRQLVELAEAAGAGVLLSAEMTGEWEKRIVDIQAGAYDPDRFMGEVRTLAAQVVEQVRAAPAATVAEPAAAPRRGPGRRKPAPAVAQGGEAAPAAAAAPVACPRCGNPVGLTSRAWRCAGPGCALRLPAELCGHTLTAGEVAALLGSGRTPLITGFTSRHGRPFDAVLTFGPEGLGWEFPPRPSRGRRGARRDVKAAGSGGKGRLARGGKRAPVTQG